MWNYLKRAPAQHLFWFLSGTFLGQEQTHIRLIQIKYKVERAGEMPILEDIWTTPANLQIKGYCSLLQSCLLWCWIIPKKIYPEPTISIPDPMSFWNSTDCRRAEIPSAGGLASARCWTTTWPLWSDWNSAKNTPIVFWPFGSIWCIGHIGYLFWLHHPLPLSFIQSIQTHNHIRESVKNY